METEQDHYFIKIDDGESKMITWSCDTCDMAIDFPRGIIISKGE